MSLHLAVNEHDHVMGPANARVTLVEYGDYECPYCGNAYPILKAVQKRLHATMAFVFRNFPLGEMHPYAEKAAEAAEAAAAQGKFWEMHDALYEHQDALDHRHLIGYAQKLGLDVARFTQELDGNVYLPRVKADFSGGARSGVNGTPTLFIDGVRYDGDWTSVDALVAALTR